MIVSTLKKEEEEENNNNNNKIFEGNYTVTMHIL